MVDRGARRGRTDPRSVRSRAAIAAAAVDRFLELGYAATSVADIAASAGVAVQTVYNTVGNKAAVLSHALDASAAGVADQTTVRDRLRAEVGEATNAGEVIDVLVDWFCEVHPRIAPILQVIEEAAAADAEVAALLQRRERQRFDGYREAAAAIAERTDGPVHGRDDAIAAAMWSTAHPRTWRFLVEVEGWSPAQYRAWLDAQLRAMLLPVARRRTTSRPGPAP